MPVEYSLESKEIEVPKNTGVEGFLHTLREILRLPRVQRIVITTSSVTYERFVKEGEITPSRVSFEQLEPWHIIRNADLEEVAVNGHDPYRTVVNLLQLATKEQLHPTSFVTGADSMLASWFSAYGATPINTSATTLCGLPIYRDRQLPDTALILCAGYARDAALIDTQKSYKVEMSLPYPETTVEVM